jgi:hypothetical protein
MSFGGFLGMGESYHPLPWKSLTYDTPQGGYVVDIDKNKLQAAPSYKAGEEIMTCRLAEFNWPQSRSHNQPSNIQWIFNGRTPTTPPARACQPKLDQRRQPKRLDRADQRQPRGAFG